MSRTLAPPIDPARQLEADEEATPRSVVLEGVSWELYEHFLRELNESPQHVRLTYDDGRLEIMSPPIENPHEQQKKFLGRVVETYALANRLEITGLGSITLRKKEKRKGVEPDECYYVQSKAPAMRVKKLDLKKYPPPDLGIEIDESTSSIPREPIYAALGVAEIWRVRREVLTILHRQPSGKYKAAKKSLAFPKLTAADLNRFLTLAYETSQNQAVFAFWDWLQENR